MYPVTHYLTIDLLRESVDGTIFIREASIGHRLVVSFTQGGKFLPMPAGEEGIVQFVYKIPDGTKSDVEMSVNQAGSAAVMIPRAALANTGVVDCEVRVYTTATGTWTTSPPFTITVGEVIYDEDAQQEIVSDPTVYEQIVASETTRGNNETTRQNQETARQNAEAARVLAEAARVLAEEARAAAEEARIAAGAITRADVDDAISGESVNPVQNKTIKAALDAKLNTADIQTSITMGLNPVTSKAIYYALQGKQDALEWDATPTAGSQKPVTSDGIYTAIQAGAQTKTGTFTLDQWRTSATVEHSKITQIGNIVHVSLVINLGEGIGSSSVILGTITGVTGPVITEIVPCLTSGSGNAGTHFGYATLGVMGYLAVNSSQSTDQYIYINICYQTAG